MSGMNYYVNGKTAITAATIDHAITQLWNPSAGRRLTVWEIHVFKQAAGAADEPVLRRSTARGTAGSSIVPTAVNQGKRDIAPPSGAIVDLAAFTAQPTLEALGLAGGVAPAAVGSGFIWTFPDGLMIPAGNGLVLTTGIALAFPVSRVSWVFSDS